MLVKQADYAVRGLQALENFSQTGDRSQAETVTRLEKEADDLRRVLIEELNRTFVTPIDREDIFALSRAIDDMLDYANTTVEEMTLLNVEPNDYVRQLVSVLHEAASNIHRGVRHLNSYPKIATDYAVRAKGLENRAEAIYREALRALFADVRDLESVVYVLKMREVYRHLSNTADRGDEAANIITDIVVKTS